MGRAGPQERIGSTGVKRDVHQVNTCTHNAHVCGETKRQRSSSGGCLYNCAHVLILISKNTGLLLKTHLFKNTPLA